jgi:16S rRNA (cytosine1402-N4)-methyltransferase
MKHMCTKQHEREGRTMTDRGPAQGRHVPVMRDRILDLLAPALERPVAVHVDGTLGMGGHAEGVLERFPDCVVVGIDRDREALALSEERLARFGDRFRPVHAVYDEIAEVVGGLDVPAVNGILFDLGVSSLQLDEADRGFAYRVDAPLDMRMDQSTGQTAADVLNRYSVEDLTRILRDYGEERFARKIASAVVRDRATEPFTTSGRLVELLRRVIPMASQRQSGHPAKRTFQALRIEVNDELAVWSRAIDEAIDVLAVGGRIAVLSYHSLEDRATKRAFAAGATSSTPPGLPVELPEHAAYLSLVTRGAEAPSDDEVTTNPRAASARLRVAERVRDTSTRTSASRTRKGPTR